jgi:hypothetical protein
VLSHPPSSYQFISIAGPVGKAVVDLRAIKMTSKMGRRKNIFGTDLQVYCNLLEAHCKIGKERL